MVSTDMLRKGCFHPAIKVQTGKMRPCQQCHVVSIRQGASVVRQDERLFPATVQHVLQVEQLVGVSSSSCISQASKVTIHAPIDTLCTYGQCIV